MVGGEGEILWWERHGKDVHGRRGRKKALLGGADSLSNWSEPLSKRLVLGVPG